MALALLLIVLVSGFHWLLEPAIEAATSLLQLVGLPWLLLLGSAWLIAGREQDAPGPKA